MVALFLPVKKSIRRLLNVTRIRIGIFSNLYLVVLLFLCNSALDSRQKAGDIVMGIGHDIPSNTISKASTPQRGGAILLNSADNMDNLQEVIKDATKGQAAEIARLIMMAMTDPMKHLVLTEQTSICRA